MLEPFLWSDAFAVGETDLDAEHRRIVELINEICIRAKAGRRESIGSLLHKAPIRLGDALSE
jgi:hemerythrin